MKRIATVLLLTLVLAPALGVAADTEKKEWIPLFDGKSLDGWVPKITGYEAGVNFGDTFRVENGILKVAYDRYDAFGGRFGHLFYKTPFSHYVLVVEYRFVGEQAKDGPDWAFRNSGAMIHGQPRRRCARTRTSRSASRSSSSAAGATASPAPRPTSAPRARTW
jgi:hypothetical protein